MAHFAEIDEDNKVLRVLVFDNNDVDANGGDQSEQAAEFIQTIEKRQGLKIASLEEIAFYKKYISKKDIIKIVSSIKGSEYANYLLSVIK